MSTDSQKLAASGLAGNAELAKQLSAMIAGGCVDPCASPPKSSTIAYYGFLGQAAGIGAYMLLVAQASFFTYSSWLQFVQDTCSERSTDAAQVGAALTGTQTANAQQVLDQE